jgi:hypothetical protein
VAKFLKNGEERMSIAIRLASYNAHATPDDMSTSHIRLGLLLVAAAVWLYGWIRSRKDKQGFRQYVSTLGFEYQARINPAELDLYATSFFGRFDIAKDVISGTIDGVKFVHFLQETASGRGNKAGLRAIVAFDVGPDTADRQPETCTDGFTLEVSNRRAFMWREQDTDEDEGLERFLARARAACQQAVRLKSAHS